jgi:hypothetical protein
MDIFVHKENLSYLINKALDKLEIQKGCQFINQRKKKKKIMCNDKSNDYEEDLMALAIFIYTTMFREQLNLIIYG